MGGRIVWASVVGGQDVVGTVGVGVGTEEGGRRVLAVRKAFSQHVGVDAQPHHGQETAWVPRRHVEAHAILQEKYQL